ncbi:MAG: ankyrin repeat domain-containing protein [Rhodospirillales bacterium]|nr:ankyrin repeat domain-containing protein [Rhodospirillales bacterium]MCB9996401.1 ankyrin repeat domain-containing protein [Rhodospirillales bacterium]
MSAITKEQFFNHVKDPAFSLSQEFLSSCRQILDARDDRENSALIWAAINNDTYKMIQLSVAGADMFAANTDGDTAMMWAAFHGNIPAMRVMVQKGAEMDVRSQYGDTPLIWAAINGQADAVGFVLEQVSDLLDKPTGFGVTALMTAAGEGHEDTVSLLIDWGADLYKIDANGLNALMWARRAGQDKTAKLIETAMAQNLRGIVDPPLPQSRFASAWEDDVQDHVQGPREKIVRNSPVPVLIDFYADYCPPCRALSPVLDQLQQDYGSRIKVMKVDTTNIRDHSAADARFFKTMMDDLAVRAIPTLALFREGACVAVKRDGGTLDTLKCWIDAHVEVSPVPRAPHPG